VPASRKCSLELALKLALAGAADSFWLARWVSSVIALLQAAQRA